MVTGGETSFDVQTYLLKDERVVWSARPVRKYFLKYILSQDPSRLMGYYFFFFGLIFALMPLLFSFNSPKQAPGGEPPIIVFSAFGLFFAGIGYSMSFGRRRRAIKLFTNTTYYLTDKRALIVSGADRPTLSAIDLRRVPQVSLSLVDRTIGNIVFGEADPAIQKGFWWLFDAWSWWGLGHRRRVEGFIAIGDAEETMRRITQIEDGLK